MSLTATTLPYQRETRSRTIGWAVSSSTNGDAGDGAAGSAGSEPWRAQGRHIVIRAKRRRISADRDRDLDDRAGQERPAAGTSTKKYSSPSERPKNRAFVPSMIVFGLIRTSHVPTVLEPIAITIPATSAGQRRTGR